MSAACRFTFQFFLKKHRFLTPHPKNPKSKFKNLTSQPLPLPSFHKPTGVVTCGKTQTSPVLHGVFGEREKTDLK